MRISDLEFRRVLFRSIAASIHLSGVDERNDAEVAEAVARLKREFVDRAAAQRIIVHVARAKLLIAEAPHRSPAARIEPPRRRDVGAAGTDDRDRKSTRLNSSH